MEKTEENREKKGGTVLVLVCLPFTFPTSDVLLKAHTNQGLKGTCNHAFNLCKTCVALS